MVSNVYDLANIRLSLTRSYSLSNDIDASITRKWNDDKGFIPIYGTTSGNLFHGEFEGNGFTIKNLCLRCLRLINRPNEIHVGVFNRTIGHNRVRHPSYFKNVMFENCYIRGKNYVGIVGTSQFTTLTM